MLAALGGAFGCGMLPKGNNVATRPPLNDRLPANGDLTRNRGTANGVLAGQVIDITNQRRAGASLTVQPLDGGQAGEVQSVATAEVTTPNVGVMKKLYYSKTADVDGKPTGITGVGGVNSS